MKVGCLPYHALAASTLECFFSAECLKETASRISSLPAKSRPVPLNGSAMRSFLPNTSVSAIFTYSMLDRWQESSDFSGYFHSCEPVQCSFTTLRKNRFIYLTTLLIGVFGGLTVALHIITPFLVRAVRYVFHFIKRTLLSGRKHQSVISHEAVGSSTTNSFAEHASRPTESPITSAGIYLRVLIPKHHVPF